MKRLTKEQVSRREELVKEINDAKEEVAKAITAANEKVNAYNDTVRKAAEFRDEVVGEMEEYYGEKSERWQEGDAGQNYDSWKNDWESASLDEISELELSDSLDHADTLEQLAEDPEG